jgi:predicted ATP-dependent endonuclease of OLD family
MKIKTVSIKHFRGIEDLPPFELKNLSMLIGNNGTSKTSILEAINFALSPSFLSGRIKHTDFFKGQDHPIEITLEFQSSFKAMLPDGFQKQEVDCNKVYLKVKKRDRAGSGKAFSDIVVVEHYVVPVAPRTNEKGWEVVRKNNSKFRFDYRLLTFPIEIEGLPRSYYYGKNREKQIQKGFNSSISSVYDDFNWRFIKEVRKEKETPTDPLTPDFFVRKQTIENEIIQKIDEKAIQKTFNTLNKKLQDLGIPNIGISFFDGNAPFDSAYLNQKLEGLEIPVAQLGSGIEMIISLLFLETLASLSKENFIIIIDEPELHLHPTLQNKFIAYLVGLSINNQVLLSTHSPYFFKNSITNQDIELLISSNDLGKVLVENTGENFGLFPWSPSWGEINFQAYNLPTIEFHNELYGYIQESNTVSTETAVEAFFLGKGQKKDKQWKRLHNGQVGNPYDITLMTFIRNTIHHPDNTHNLPYTETELEYSIKTMIRMLKIP